MNIPGFLGHTEGCTAHEGAGSSLFHAYNASGSIRTTGRDETSLDVTFVRSARELRELFPPSRLSRSQGHVELPGYTAGTTTFVSSPSKLEIVLSEGLCRWLAAMVMYSSYDNCHRASSFNSDPQSEFTDESESDPEPSVSLSRCHMALTDGLSRRDSTVLFHLRSGHAPLNAHLHRIKCAASPMCDACSEADETVVHYIYECPARLSERRKLRKAAGKNWRDRAYLMGTETGVKALMAYVRETGRMRWGRKEEEEGRAKDQEGEETRRMTNSGGAEGDAREQGNGVPAEAESGAEETDDGDSEAEVEGMVEEAEITDGENTMEGLLRWFKTLPRGQTGRGDKTQRVRDATTRAD